MTAKCRHQHISISAEWAQHCYMTSIDPDVENAYLTQIRPVQMGPAGHEGYWSRAHLFVRCHDCGHTASYTSTDWRQFPKWLIKHWHNLVATGGVPADIQRHYRMFEEAAA